MTNHQLQRRLRRAARRRASSLNLTRAGIESLPPSIGELTALRGLTLNRNRLTRLPPEIGRLVSLERLLLWRNRLEDLPAGIARLTRLRELSISKNRFAELPAAICDLAALEFLDLDGNALAALPPGIGNLARLRILRLLDNRLAALPEEFARLSALEALDARHNAFDHFPEPILALERLRWLNLRRNRIGRIPPGIARLRRLRTLVLHDNPIEALPPEIGSLERLRELYVTDARLTALPIELGRLARLRVLDLRFNRIESLPLELGRLPRLESLRLEGNPLGELPAEVRKRSSGAILDWLRERAAAAGPIEISEALEAGDDEDDEEDALPVMGAPPAKPPPPAPGRWTRAVQDAGALAAGPLLAIIPRLPHRAVLRLGRAAGRIAFAFDRRYKPVARENLAASSLSGLDPDAILREAYARFLVTMAESVHATRWTEANFKSLIDVEGEEHWEAAAAGGRGVIVASAHLGNWELIPRALCDYTGRETASIARELHNPRLSALLWKMRQARGGRFYSTTESGLGYLRTILRGGTLFMLADQAARVRSIPAAFLGREARTPVGPAFLARKTGAAILPAFIRRREGDPRRHVLRFTEPIEPRPGGDEGEELFRLLQALMGRIERAIADDPASWLWMYDRWKQEVRIDLPDGEIDYLRRSST